MRKPTVRTFSSDTGATVVLRHPTRSDFDDYFAFAVALAKEDTYIVLNVVPTEREERKFFSGVMRGIRSGDAIYVSAYVDSQFAGNGRVLRGGSRERHVGHIGISLYPKYRDLGIGTALMKALVSEAKNAGYRLLTLSCFENNPRAIHVYEKLGFKTAGTVPDTIAWKERYVGKVIMFLPL